MKLLMQNGEESNKKYRNPLLFGGVSWTFLKRICLRNSILRNDLWPTTSKPLKAMLYLNRSLFIWKEVLVRAFNEYGWVGAKCVSVLWVLFLTPIVLFLSHWLALVAPSLLRCSPWLDSFLSLLSTNSLSLLFSNQVCLSSSLNWNLHCSCFHGHFNPNC